MREHDKKMLYLDCSGGISGDMTVAALLDLGADREVLMSALASLPENSGFSTRISRVKKSGIDCCDFSVILDEAHENHDHDMEYLYGASGEHTHTHSDAEGHIHTHTHSHEEAHTHTHTHSHVEEHMHTHAHQEHRNLQDIEQILADCEMSDHALELASRIFEILAEAESKAHGLPVEEVHFHEVGAIDSIVDIISIAVCMDNLGVEEVIIPRLAEGSGTVRTQHGLLPIPVPAVLHIAEQHSLNLEIQQVRGEYVTPTGAAFCAAVKTSDHLPERFRVVRTGLGAGKREQALPSILRAMLIEPVTEQKESAFVPDVIWKLETQLDDCSGELLGYVMERLLASGARDVWYTPIFMKKNRPAVLLSVICKEQERERLEEIVFTETTTIGIRRTRMERDILPREFDTVATVYGEAEVKIVHVGERKRVYPEYESARRIAEAAGVPLAEVYRAIALETGSDS